MYYVYIIECRDGTLYTGITTNIERRWQEHQAGKASRYTRAHGVVALLYTESQKNRSTATQREWQIKQLTRKEKIRLIKGSECSKT